MTLTWQLQIITTQEGEELINGVIVALFGGWLDCKFFQGSKLLSLLCPCCLRSLLQMFFRHSGTWFSHVNPTGLAGLRGSDPWIYSPKGLGWSYTAARQNEVSDRQWRTTKESTRCRNLEPTIRLCWIRHSSDVSTARNSKELICSGCPFHFHPETIFQRHNWAGIEERSRWKRTIWLDGVES